MEKREAELESLKATVGEKAVELEEKNKIIHTSKVDLWNVPSVILNVFK